MENQELLYRLEWTHRLTAKAILELRELIQNVEKYTPEAVQQMRDGILNSVQMNISEFEILELELEGDIG